MRAVVAQNPREESTADIVWIVGHYALEYGDSGMPFEICDAAARRGERQIHAGDCTADAARIGGQRDQDQSRKIGLPLAAHTGLRKIRRLASRKVHCQMAADSRQ
jgi:hypothetical protein